MALSDPALLNDNFTRLQGNNSTETEPPNDWSPVPSDRITDGAISHIIGGNKWAIHQGGSLEYRQPAMTTITYDFSGANAIMLLGVQASAGGQQNATFTLQLTDAFGQSATIPLTMPVSSMGSGTNFTWHLEDFLVANPLLDLANIISIKFVITTTASPNLELKVSGIITTIICVAKDTMILMADGTEKPIQNIERGDLVAADPKISSVNRVALLRHSKMPGVTPLGMVTIEKHTFGLNKPNANLIITSGHPILYGDFRYRAKCFKEFPGVKYYTKERTIASKVLPPNDDESYSLYNLQFEHDGFFVANGIVVESIPPLSTISPLPKELYFNPQLYFKPQRSNMPQLKKNPVKPLV